MTEGSMLTRARKNRVENHDWNTAGRKRICMYHMLKVSRHKTRKREKVIEREGYIDGYREEKSEGTR